MDIETQFLEACQRGDDVAIKSFLDQGVSSNCNKVVGNMVVYPLWVVSCWPLYQQFMYDTQTIEAKYMECTFLLLENGADLDKVMLPYANHTIRDGLRNAHPSLLKKCEEYENENDTLYIKGAISDD